MTDIPGRVPPRLELCPRCSEHIYAGTNLCPHCGGEVPALLAAREEAIAEALDALQRLEAALALS
ncbi:MAG: hypothetical protein IT381_11030 [Deltaproteobacteria bacterium]|nr:hypothetical protein [Deltaproteobacteria bacterium]